MVGRNLPMGDFFVVTAANGSRSLWLFQGLRRHPVTGAEAGIEAVRLARLPSAQQ